MTPRRITVTALTAATAVVLTACSSSGGGVSTTKLESKLKKEPQLQTAAQTKTGSQLIDCIAKAMEKQADPTSLKKYVDGKINLADVGGKDKSADHDVKVEAASCAKSVVAKASSSPKG